MSYPIATTTETEVDANGVSYTVTATYVNYYDDPPYPSDCHCEFDAGMRCVGYVSDGVLGQSPTLREDDMRTRST